MPITISATRTEKATLISTTSGMPLAPVAARIRPFSIDMKPITWLTALRREIIISRPSRMTDSAKARSSRASVPACAVIGSITMIDSATRPMPASMVRPMPTTGLDRAVDAEAHDDAVQRDGDDDRLETSAIAAVM